jgi:nicotinamide-nucleotide amidase
MVIELVTTGTELMLGNVLNTHQQWLCAQLTRAGWTVARQVSVADTAAEIAGAAREALSRADLVITTGGLGPTSDDLTRDSIARLLGKPLRQDARVLEHIRGFFAARSRPMPESTKLQALVPEGAKVLPNPRGTAPGLAIEVKPNPLRRGGASSWLIMLPGPPRELRPLFTDSVLPLLAEVFPPPAHHSSVTLRATGVGESLVQEKIERALRALTAAGLEIGYCSRPGQVDIRLSARGPNAANLVPQAETITRARLDKDIYASGDEELESVVVRLLTERKQTLALAESCTGGCIAHRITNVPGASLVLLAGLVTYSNDAKLSLLGVRPETLAAHGAVSEAVAREMAEGARARIGADYALAATGIAGPAGGSPAKPVGTVFIALASGRGTVALRQMNPLDRESFKQLTSQQALDLLRREILGYHGP